ncbi:MAG: hypothetical protein AB7G06_07590 [Bdellovibrionales bacterium]
MKITPEEMEKVCYRVIPRTHVDTSKPFAFSPWKTARYYEQNAIALMRAGNVIAALKAKHAARIADNQQSMLVYDPTEQTLTPYASGTLPLQYAHLKPL